jgi:hypothetical protein
MDAEAGARRTVFACDAEQSYLVRVVVVVAGNKGRS